MLKNTSLIASSTLDNKGLFNNARLLGCNYTICIIHVMPQVQNSPPSLVCTKLFGSIWQNNIVFAHVLFNFAALEIRRLEARPGGEIR